MKILSAAEMREVDRLTTARYGIPGVTLMESAGKSVADFVARRFPHFDRKKIVVLCGKGNNGGDGFVVARHLREMGAKPDVYLFATPETLQGDAAANCRRWQETSAELYVVHDANEWEVAKSTLASADLIVDALLGTGIRGPVEGLLRTVIDGVNHSVPPDAIVVAVDIPSGLNADTGEAANVAINAQYTVTFTAPKPGLFQGAAYTHVGQLIVTDIGSPWNLIEEIGTSAMRWSDPREFRRFGKPRKPDGHKGDYGHALIVAGAVGKTGAAVLASWAALRAGAGLVTVATPEPALAIVATHNPEIMTEPMPATSAGTFSMRALRNGSFAAAARGKAVLGIGPGISTKSQTQDFVRSIVHDATMPPIILDADGLNAFAGRATELTTAKTKLALTPHPGEMSRLAGCSTADVQKNRLDLARECAKDWNCFIVLKGHQTITAAPDGRIWINSTGNPGMGTGGTGDVLTGMLSGLTAQFKADAWPELLAFGVWLHGLSGDLAYEALGESPLMASDLILHLPRALQHFRSELDRA